MWALPEKREEVAQGVFDVSLTRGERRGCSGSIWCEPYPRREKRLLGEYLMWALPEEREEVARGVFDMSLTRGERRGCSGSIWCEPYPRREKRLLGEYLMWALPEEREEVARGVFDVRPGGGNDATLVEPVHLVGSCSIKDDVGTLNTSIEDRHLYLGNNINNSSITQFLLSQIIYISNFFSKNLSIFSLFRRGKVILGWTYIIF